MAIYEIFEGDKEEGEDGMTQGELFDHLDGFEGEGHSSFRDRFLSTLFARLFFFLLLIADLIWGVYVVPACFVTGILYLITGRKSVFFRHLYSKYYLSLKRFFVCGLSLLVALFSPALGVMFACTYFLMYDKKGIDEVVPGILQAQFKEFFSPIKG